MYEDGAVFSPKVLDIKSEDLMKRFTEGVANIAAVSLQIGYPTVASVPHSIVNGFKNVLAVAVTTDITFPEAEQVFIFFIHSINFPLIFDPSLSLPLYPSPPSPSPTQAKAFVADPSAFVQVVTQAVEETDKGKEEVEEKKEEEEEEESDDDMGFGLFD